MRTVKWVLGLLVGGFAAYAFLSLAGLVPFGLDKMLVAREYLARSVPELGSVNTVTAVVVLFRGFDTLGEVTVLFLAATGAAFLLHGLPKPPSETPPTFISAEATRILFPLLLIFGAYIFLHGHLTPGGGFPGGVIIAAAYLMLYLARPRFEVKEAPVSLTESLAGLTFAGVGLLGLWLLGSFLANFLPPGTPGRLLSAGVIPLIYAAVGFKVGSELAGLLWHMREERHA